jgi:hypothetical protein
MTASVDRLGLSRSFVKGLLAKTRGLHTETISERKNGPRRLAIIESHALNSLDQCAKKNPRCIGSTSSRRSRSSDGHGGRKIDPLN